MLWPRAIISLKHSLHHNSLYKQLYSSRHCLLILGEAPHNPLAIVHPHPHLPVLNSLLKGKIPGMAQIQFLIIKVRQCYQTSQLFFKKMPICTLHILDFLMVIFLRANSINRKVDRKCQN